MSAADPSVEPMESARRLARQVADLVSDGKDAAAKAAFTRNWRESVPELPVRFAVTLDAVNEPVALALARRITGGTSRQPRLALRLQDDTYEVVVGTGRNQKLLGRLPVSDNVFLLDLGERANVFQPHLLQIKNGADADGVICAIELVRREDKQTEMSQIAFQDAVAALPNDQ